jgi:hypothetical protein
MKLLRNLLNEQFNYLFYLNFADRPDCLFSGVHQKLSIVIGNTLSEGKETYSSTYNYWYKDERKNLFENISVYRVSSISEKYIPKIGDKTAYSIFKKIFNMNNDYNIYSYITDKNSTSNSIYLNMRGCFWMKAFPFSPGSNEYKSFSIENKYRDYILCILNSSLFFFFWIAISDCWHITQKDLEGFKIPKPQSISIFTDLARELLESLDRTKAYVGTVQTEFEYKHKLCKSFIDNIDNELAKIYGLTENQLNYIKNFALKYRLGDGA